MSSWAYETENQLGGGGIGGGGSGGGGGGGCDPDSIASSCDAHQSNALYMQVYNEGTLVRADYRGPNTRSWGSDAGGCNWGVAVFQGYVDIPYDGSWRFKQIMKNRNVSNRSYMAFIDDGGALLIHQRYKSKFC